MRSSGKLAIGAAIAAAGLMAMTVFTLNEPVLICLAGAVLVAYIASVWTVLARGRHLAIVLGAVGSGLAIAFSIAFLRMWGLAFNKDAAALGPAVASRDSDVYFYLAVVTGLLTLAFLFCAAVWPSRAAQLPRKPRRTPERQPAARRPAPRKPAAKKPAPKKPAPRAAAGTKPAGKKPAPARTR